MQRCLTFPTGSAHTHSKHHSVRGLKGMNIPCLPFCSWKLDFLVGKPIEIPTLSHVPKAGNILCAERTLKMFSTSRHLRRVEGIEKGVGIPRTKISLC